MRKLKERFQDPFFRATWNVVNAQIIFALLSILIFGFAIWHQQQTTQRIINENRALFAAGQKLDPATLDMQLYQLRNETVYSTLSILAALSVIFGILIARYALSPTRTSLDSQKRFIGNAAHELRTPLAIIRTNTEVALMDPALEGYARSTMQTTIEELNRISDIINNLLSFESLIQPGSVKLEPLLLRDIAGAVVHRHIDMAKRYGINIGVDAPSAPAPVMGNKVALEQAVTNLVKNALNYTPQHRNNSVVVRIDDHGDEVALSVIDTGIGIARKDLINIFQPFYRGDTGRERGIGSGTSGLGLAIVNEIVRAHNGHITIRSALNRGTTIELTFPKATVEDQMQGTADAEDTNGKEYEEKVS